MISIGSNIYLLRLADSRSAAFARLMRQFWTSTAEIYDLFLERRLACQRTALRRTQQMQTNLPQTRARAGHQLLDTARDQTRRDDEKGTATHITLMTIEATQQCSQSKLTPVIAVDKCATLCTRTHPITAPPSLAKRTDRVEQPNQIKHVLPRSVPI